MPPKQGEFYRFLFRALDTLSVENPQDYQNVKKLLFDHCVTICAGVENFDMKFSGTVIELTEPSLPNEIELNFELQTLMSLLDGEIALTDAVMSDRLIVMGPLAALEKLERGFMCFIRGGMACPTLPRLLDDFRRRII